MRAGDSSTSAPCAASVRPQTGPAMTRVRSSTRTPASGRWRRAAGASAARRRSARSAAPAAPPPPGPADGRPIRRSSAWRRRIARPRPRHPRRRSASQPSQRGCHRLARAVATEQLQHAGAVVREIGVQPDPAAIAAAIGAGDVVPAGPRLAAGERQVALGAEFQGGVAHVDARRLGRPAARLVHRRRRRGRRGDAGLRRRADPEGGGQRRFRPAQDHLAERRRGQPGQAPEAAETSRRASDRPWHSSRIGPRSPGWNFRSADRRRAPSLGQPGAGASPDAATATKGRAANSFSTTAGTAAPAGVYPTELPWRSSTTRRRTETTMANQQTSGGGGKSNPGISPMTGKRRERRGIPAAPIRARRTTRVFCQ